MNTSNNDNTKTIEEMIKNGELSFLSECSYGEAIADDEKNNTLKNKNNK